MARITVEDCLKKIPNRFQMVLVAAYRARHLTQGYAPKVEAKDKPAVVALREIAKGEVGLEMLKRVRKLSVTHQAFIRSGTFCRESGRNAWPFCIQGGR